MDGANATYHPELWEAFLDETSPYYHSYGHIMSKVSMMVLLPHTTMEAVIYERLIIG